jgi:hypothetical protein
MNGRKLFRYMRRLARSHPHLAVSLVYDQDGLKIGLMNIIPQPDDWYYPPVKVSELEVPILKDPAWYARIPSSAGTR